jgi:hypothetical protein
MTEMASDVIEITRSRKSDRTRVRLVEELADVASRLHSEAEVPQSGSAGGDFLDVAQGMEQQERARLSATRLAPAAPVGISWTLPRAWSSRSARG